MDPRLEALTQWVSETLQGRPEVAPASGDASFRRYFRARLGGRSYILMDAPPGKEDIGPFVAIATRLHRLGLNVPEILAQEPGQGFLLLSDLGQQLYLGALNESTVERLYGDALGALVVLQAGVFEDRSFLLDYSHELLMREMELFREWYLGRHLGLHLASEHHDQLSRAFEALARSALEQPKVWVHRDYHSRNLMVTRDNNPGILDFQDAVLGPITYDLVSLLRDCYIAWPRARVEDWALGYHALALQSGLLESEDERLFLEWFDRMGLQRHLKATGIFARLFHRDGKPGYLNDIPRNFSYMLDVAGRYPDLAALHALLLRSAPAPTA